MKNKLMLLIVLAGFTTAVYRFLPVDVKSRIDAQLHKVAQVKNLVPGVSTATANPAQKKYVLNIPDAATSTSAVDNLASAYMQHKDNAQVHGQGEVVKILFDDTQGAKHQKFIVRSQMGITVLVAHNIDLARRINSLAVGDTINFYGEYEWNEKGGVVHWTHSDPRGRHPAGWIKHKGVTYQ